MKHLNKIGALVVTAALFFVASCVASGNQSAGGDRRKNQEGWKDANTYVMVVVGGWDRSRYYIQGKEPEAGKQAKSAIMLQDDSKTAAKNKAMRNFLEKVIGAEVKSKTGVEDGALIADVIQSGLEGKIGSPSAIEENYTPENECRITYEFSAQGLKKLISDRTAEIMKKQGK